MHKSLALLSLLLPLSSFASDTYTAALSSDKSENILQQNIRSNGPPVSSSSRYLSLTQCGEGDKKWTVNDNYDTSTHFISSVKSNGNEKVYDFTIKYNEIDCDNLTLKKHAFSKEVKLNNNEYTGKYKLGSRNFTVAIGKNE